MSDPEPRQPGERALYERLGSYRFTSEHFDADPEAMLWLSHPEPPLPPPPDPWLFRRWMVKKQRLMSSASLGVAVLSGHYLGVGPIWLGWLFLAIAVALDAWAYGLWLWRKD